MAHMIPNISTPVISYQAFRDVIFQEHIKNYYTTKGSIEKFINDDICTLCY